MVFSSEQANGNPMQTVAKSETIAKKGVPSVKFPRINFDGDQLELIFRNYCDIMECEGKLRPDFVQKDIENGIEVCDYDGATTIYGICWRLYEIAKSSLVSRGYNYRYSLTDSAVAFESVAAHTNLATAILEEAIIYCFSESLYCDGKKHAVMLNGYSLDEIREAIRIHDLPENEYGDVPDNGSRDELAKIAFEKQYFDKYFEHCPAERFEHYPTNRCSVTKIKALLIRMSADSDDPVARLIYMADKVSAIIMTLTYDAVDMSPVMRYDDETASERDQKEMRICDICNNGWYYASEMWTIDHLKIRELNRADDYGFFTAIIVMMTLLLHGNEWYDWRAAEYEGVLSAEQATDDEQIAS